MATVKAKDIEWTENPPNQVPHFSGILGYSRFRFSIVYYRQYESYLATVYFQERIVLESGLGKGEYLATLDEAKQFCQEWIDGFVQSIAEITT